MHRLRLKGFSMKVKVTRELLEQLIHLPHLIEYTYMQLNGEVSRKFITDMYMDLPVKEYIKGRALMIEALLEVADGVDMYIDEDLTWSVDEEQIVSKADKTDEFFNDLGSILKDSGISDE